MIRLGNVKMAREAIRSSRWRSALTILGIVIGIVSVVTIVSVGEGAKQRVVGQIDQGGSDLITVRPGKFAAGQSPNPMALNGIYAGAMSEADVRIVEGARGVREAVPFSYVNGVPKSSGRTYSDALVIGTTEKLPDVLGQGLEFGNFFPRTDMDRGVAVIGKRVAEQLFQENVPVGKLFTIRDKQFVVRGVFEEFETSPLVPSADYNRAIFIPYPMGVEIGGGQANIYQVLARPSNPEDTSQAAAAIRESLAHNHSAEQDFSVLEQKDMLAMANSTLDFLTHAVTAIAAIALLVAGIGIMNIMLVSVTERMHEIGIRKAIGATNRQILDQFLTEAVLLSLMGGLFGVLASILVNYLLRIFTDLTPVLTWPIMVIAVGVSVVVGVIFGIAPALKAARKHPIEALRNE